MEVRQCPNPRLILIKPINHPYSMEYKILDVSANPITGDYTISAQAKDDRGTNFTAFVTKEDMKGYPSAKTMEAIRVALNKRYGNATGATLRPEKAPNLRPLINSVVESGNDKKGKASK